MANITISCFCCCVLLVHHYRNSLIKSVPYLCKMVKSCSVLGCKQRYCKESGISFHRFPAQFQIKELWIKALARHNWQPSAHSLVCGRHFLTGRPSADPKHPDYVPSIFPHVVMHHKYKSSFAKRVILMSDTAATQASNFITSNAVTGSLKESSTGSQSSKLRKTNKLTHRKYIPNKKKAVASCTANDSGQPVLLQPTSHEEESTLCEKDKQLLLLQRLGEQNMELQEEMRTQLRKQQSEINLLQVQVDLLQNKNAKLLKEPKYTSRDVMSDAFLVDKNRCYFYTGIPNLESFTWLLNLLDNEIQSNPIKLHSSKQLLAVLMKLKCDFLHIDLGYRFGLSPSTISRLLKLWIPVLIKSLTEFINYPENDKNLILEQLLMLESDNVVLDEQKLWPDKLLLKAMNYKCKVHDEELKDLDDADNIECL